MKYIIDENYNGARLDRFLRKTLSTVPLTEIFKAIRTGNIKLNGKKAKENSKVLLGDIVEIFKILGYSSEIIIKNEENKKKLESFIILNEEEKILIKNSIVFENNSIIIVNKPYGLVMHKGSGHSYGLTEMICAYLKNSDFTFVNRIDRDTSGLVIGTKTIPMARIVSEEIRENKIDKLYYILVHGCISKKEFSKTSYLKKIDDKVIELDKFEPNAKESTSHFKVIKSNKNYSLLIGKLDTGRTHQLRVQLASMNHPIVGDPRYGKNYKNSRMMLHSFYLDIKKLNLIFELPLPKEFDIF